MIPKKKKYRRSDTKKETEESKLIKYLRESRALSMRKAADLIGVSCATINHSENGRKDLTPGLILRFLNAYGYTLEQFEGMLKGEFVIPDHLRSECIEIIKRLDDQKLKTVKAFLMTF